MVQDSIEYLGRRDPAGRFLMRSAWSESARVRPDGDAMGLAEKKKRMESQVRRAV